MCAPTASRLSFSSFRWLYCSHKRLNFFEFTTRSTTSGIYITTDSQEYFVQRSHSNNAEKLLWITFMRDNIWLVLRIVIIVPTTKNINSRDTSSLHANTFLFWGTSPPPTFSQWYHGLWVCNEFSHYYSVQSLDYLLKMMLVQVLN